MAITPIGGGRRSSSGIDWYGLNAPNMGVPGLFQAAGEIVRTAGQYYQGKRDQEDLFSSVESAGERLGIAPDALDQGLKDYGVDFTRDEHGARKLERIRDPELFQKGIADLQGRVVARRQAESTVRTIIDRHKRRADYDSVDSTRQAAVDAEIKTMGENWGFGLNEAGDPVVHDPKAIADLEASQRAKMTGAAGVGGGKGSTPDSNPHEGLKTARDQYKSAFSTTLRSYPDLLTGLGIEGMDPENPFAQGGATEAFLQPDFFTNLGGQQLKYYNNLSGPQKQQLKVLHHAGQRLNEARLAVGTPYVPTESQMRGLLDVGEDEGSIQAILFGTGTAEEKQARGEIVAQTREARDLEKIHYLETRGKIVRGSRGRRMEGLADDLREEVAARKTRREPLAGDATAEEAGGTYLDTTVHEGLRPGASIEAHGKEFTGNIDDKYADHPVAHTAKWKKEGKFSDRTLAIPPGDPNSATTAVTPLANKIGYPPEVLAAIIYAESGGDPASDNGSQEGDDPRNRHVGLIQFGPEFRRWLFKDKGWTTEKMKDVKGKETSKIVLTKDKDAHVRGLIKSMPAEEQMRLVDLYLTDYVGKPNSPSKIAQNDPDRNLKLYALIHSGSASRLDSQDFASGRTTRQYYNDSIKNKIAFHRPTTAADATGMAPVPPSPAGPSAAATTGLAPPPGAADTTDFYSAPAAADTTEERSPADYRTTYLGLGDTGRGIDDYAGNYERFLGGAGKDLHWPPVKDYRQMLKDSEGDDWDAVAKFFGFKDAAEWDKTVRGRPWKETIEDEKLRIFQGRVPMFKTSDHVAYPDASAKGLPHSTGEVQLLSMHAPWRHQPLRRPATRGGGA